MTPRRSSYSKTASNPNRPTGFYSATVTRVDGKDVYVKVPRFTYEFEHGPIPYEGSVPEVGDDTFVTFLEGNQDDVVGLFPGSIGRWEGPMQPTYFVAASDTRPELRRASDYEADGTDDDVELIAAIDAALTLGGGRVFLSDGNFACTSVFDYTSVVTRNLIIEGAGQDLTTLRISDLGLGAGDGAFDMNLNGGHLGLKNLTIEGDNLGAFSSLLRLTGGGTVILENISLVTTTSSTRLLWAECDLSINNLNGTSSGSGFNVKNWLHMTDSTLNVVGTGIESDEEDEGVLLERNTLNCQFGVGIFLSGITATSVLSVIENNTINCLAETAVYTSGRAHIIGNTITGGFEDLPAIVVKDAIWARVDENIIDSVADEAIFIEDSDLVSIRGNEINSPTKIAIHAESSTGLHVGLVIENNEIDDTTLDAIFVDNYAHAVVGENQLTNGLGIGIHIKDTTRASVFSNKVAGADDTEPRRIYAENVDNLVLSDNQVSDKGWIEVFDCDRPVIVDNTVDTWDNATDSAVIVLSGTTDSPYVFRNIYEGASAGGVVDYGLSIGASVTNVKHGHNDFRLATNWLKDQGTGTSERGLIYLPFADEADPVVAGPNSVPYQWIGNGEIVDVIIAVDTAPTGAALIVDVNVEGTSVWATQGAQPTIAAGTTESVVTFPDASAVLVDGGIITVDVDQVGSATPGSNLTVLIRARETR